MSDPVMALRNDHSGDLDDVVVKDVEMFRAEMMDDRTLWMCCYFANGETVTFSVRSRRGPLVFTTVETPPSWTDWDQLPKESR